MRGRVLAVALGVAAVSLQSLAAAPSAQTASDAQTPQDRPRFTARVEAVRVDVLALRDGRPLLGLTAADFELRDNGVMQQIELVSLEKLPLNVVVAFDLSDSVKGARLEHLRTASGALVDALKPGDRAGLLTFSHAVTLRCPLRETFDCVRDELAKVEADGRTALVDGSYAGLVAAESDTGRSLLMVFGDRIDTASWLQPKAVIDAARRSEVVVYGAAAERNQSPFLRDLTALTGGRLLDSDEGDLRAPFLRILEEFRQRYVLTYAPRGVTSGGFHKLDVRVKRRGVSVKAREGYVSGGS
jgi:Ca-activated chloride channel homolog